MTENNLYNFEDKMIENILLYLLSSLLKFYSHA
jgi:hypothetical protein